MSDPHNAKSQTGYVFLSGGAAISWRSVKQTQVATSSNHSEIIALYETSRECVWLRSLIHHIYNSCGIMSKEDTPTVLYEDNTACVQKISCSDNLADLFTKSLPTCTFEKFVYKIGMRRLGRLLSSGGATTSRCT